MMLTKPKNRMKKHKLKRRAEPSKTKEENSGPDFKKYVENRDWAGAIAILEFKQSTDEDEKDEIATLEWLAYCAFHNGNPSKALSYFKTLMRTVGEHKVRKDIHLHIACCMYYLQMFQEAKEEAMKSPPSPARTRLLFVISHKLNDEESLMRHHQNLTDSTMDQLCLASVHYMRNHFQECVDLLKRLATENPSFIALNVYISAAYLQQDYSDVASELLAVYLQAHPDSAVAINLKACTQYRLFNGKAAFAELQHLLESGSNARKNDLLQHNAVVFKDGVNALQVLPPMVDYIPEAKLNLAIYHLKQGQVQEAYDLLDKLDPKTPKEYILKGIVNAQVGQLTGSREHLKLAQQFFQLVGASASECDTIHGRQCMASCFALLKQHDDVLIYLKSIKAYLYNDDDFNWNYGIALASTHDYKEAEETFLLIQSPDLRKQYCYLSWLARCYVRNRKPRLAWDLYLKMETSNESFNLLQLIANDCYEMGEFYYSAKAFDVLERLDPDPEYWEGKRGACVGVLQRVVAGEMKAKLLVDVVRMLENTQNSQVEQVLRVMRRYCDENGLDD